MKTKGSLLKYFLLAGLFAGFVSCSDDDNDDPIITIDDSQYGAYILSAGKYTSNKATLYYYDLKSDKTEKAIEAFVSANNISMGDSGQDMVIYGSKMYIGMYGSGLIYVTDKNGKIITTIKDDENKLQPRSLETLNGKVYVTLYDGYLARIDTTSLTIDKRIEVGPNPETVKAANNKLYVANSGGQNWQNGYNNTVSIVDSELSSRKDIEVVVNPYDLKTDKNGNLYLVSRGNYKNIASALQKINTQTNEVTVLDEGRAFYMFLDKNRLYFINKTWGDNPKSTLYYYDVNTQKVAEGSFITDGTEIPDISGVYIEPSTGNYFVTAANGTNNGDVYIFTSDGKFKSKFDAGSAYPSGVWFVKK